MFCSKCGHNTVNGNFCQNCGSSFNKNNYCYKCGAEIQQGQEICIRCGANTSAKRKFNFEYLGKYYDNEFNQMQDTDERYTGKFNWAAFMFGWIWALSKGLWVSAIIALIGSMCTGGILGVVYWFIFGFRGNYMYYSLLTKNEQKIY